MSEILMGYYIKSLLVIWILCVLQEMDFLDVVGLDNFHLCRGDPFEAAVYSLEATGEGVKRFKANSQAALSVETGEASELHTSSLELPVDFTKTDVEKVLLSLL